MIRGRSPSIRNNLIVLLMFTSTCALVMAALGTAVNDWFFSRSEMIERLHSQAAILGNNSIGALTFDDEGSASRTLSSLSSVPEIVGAVLFAKSGNALASYQQGIAPLPQRPPDTATGTIQSDLFVLHPITFDGSVIGQILIIAEHKYWNRHQTMRLATMIGLMLLSLAFALWLSRRLERVVTLPILQLTHTARRITESKDYTLRAKKLSRDEVGLLTDDFNEMLDQVQQRDIELQRVQEQLEDKVKERTVELEQLARKFEHQAYHDALTGLANRITFDNQLQLGINKINRYGGQISVLFLDLDRFKVINDTLGHAAGDQLLIEIAKRLSTRLRESDTIARLGGDEFAILLPEIGSDMAADVANKLTEAVSQPLLINGKRLQLTTSIGISVYPLDGENAAEILKHADTAMYRSKDLGRNRFTFYTEDMNQRAERRMQLEDKIRRAIANNDFTLHYQPKHNVETMEIVGIEALIRWFDTEEGMISPAEFIPLAEECGLISDIDEWVLERACREVLQLNSSSKAPISLSVNFSPSHFFKNKAVDRVTRTLDKTGFPSNQLELEITENLVGPDAADVSRQLKGIRALGVEISIDDFGIAYSSLSRLKQLPLNTLKIDRSFIQDLGKKGDDEVIVRTIISMAHSLNLKVVAEGVETQEQFQYIKRHHCDIVQGFLFGKPMPMEDLEKLVN